MLRLLVLGNGFDLAHGYPTKYIDFLSFCAYMSGIPVNENLQPTDNVVDIINDFEENNDEETKAKIISVIRDNLWIKHFIDVINELKETWIDFEKEIRECCVKCHKNNPNDSVPEFFDSATLNHDLDLMKKDFKNLIIILKIYIKIVMHKPASIYYKEILDFDPQLIINFNYTRTFHNLYVSSMQTDYIHGVADSNDINNIVLGFNTMDDKDTDIDYAEFLKYFQMVENENTTDVYNSYIAKKDDDKRVMFFGHSLDYTDEDIIKNIILESKKVYILYHNNKAKARYIKNLIDIFGKEKFIELSLTSTRSIIFVKQSCSVQTNEEFQIYKSFKTTNEVDCIFKMLSEPSIINKMPFWLLKDYTEAIALRGSIMGLTPSNIETLLKNIKNVPPKQETKIIAPSDIEEFDKQLITYLNFYNC